MSTAMDMETLEPDADFLAITQELSSANEAAIHAAAKRILKRIRKSPAALGNYCK